MALIRTCVLTIVVASIVAPLIGCGNAQQTLPEGGKRFFGPQVPPTRKSKMQLPGNRPAPP